jgi:hypothetical protein
MTFSKTRRKKGNENYDWARREEEKREKVFLRCRERVIKSYDWCIISSRSKNALKEVGEYLRESL